MGFKEGYDENRFKGRPKGSKNKSTTLMRELITDFVENNFEKIEADFNELTTREKYKIIVDLLPYCLPKIQNSDFSFEKLSDESIDEIINKIYEK